ncbi:PHB depolymerase family esterase [Allomuricauda sp. d1]|uniref:alpha/beta hydrolase family esterase n=1 Tax=Allomuricauda sp. d1 TaxID=3136725 RepID=UPI0031D32CE2
MTKQFFGYLLILFFLILSSCTDDSGEMTDQTEETVVPRATTINATLEHDGLDRIYNLYFPSNYDGDTPLPLVIVLHGGSGNAESVQGFTQMTPVAEANGFLAVYPQGAGPAGDGGFSWADGRGTTADDAAIDDVGFINTLIDILVSEYAVDENRIYLTGFSNGSFLTQKIACTSNSKIAAVASLGSTYDVAQSAECNPGRPIPTLLITGTEDPFIPYDGGEMNTAVNVEILSSPELFQFWAINNGCETELNSIDLPDSNTSDNSTVTQFEFTDCDCDANVKHLRLNGAGHTWAGVENISYEEIAGETNEDIDASTVIWEFFSQFELCDANF